MRQTSAARTSLWAMALLCAGCAGGPPEWIESPAVEGGLAATDCVRDSGKLSLDRQVAVGKARAGLARQFEQRVAAMDRAYAGAGQTPFGNVAKQVAEQMLAGLDPVRVEYIELDDVRNLCAMVTVEPEQARPLFDKVVQASGETPDDAARARLFDAFSGTGAESS